MRKPSKKELAIVAALAMRHCYNSPMEIGGNDIIVPVGLTFRGLYELLSAIRLWWPEAQIEDGKKNCPLAPPLTIPCELFVYKDASAKALVDAEGVVQEAEPFFFQILGFPDETTFVVGVDDGCEGARIVEDLARLLRGT